MKQFLLFGVSVGLNLFLGARVFWPAPPSRQPEPLSAVSPAREVPPAAVPTPSPRTPARTVFEWSMLRSTNFAAYRANLAAIGCPTSTAREILTSEIRWHYFREIESRLRPYQGQFWQNLALYLRDDEAFEAKLEPLLAQVKELCRERDDWLSAVAGPGTSLGTEPPDVWTADQQSLVDFLPAPRQEEYRALLQWAADERARMEEWALLQGTPPAASEIAQLEQAHGEALRSLLTDEEWMEYQLRTSPFARQREGWSEDPESNRASAAAAFAQAQRRKLRTPRTP